MSGGGESIEALVEDLRAGHPELGAVRAAATEPVYVVGGAVRDLLLGRERVDLDLVVEGDAAALAARLGAEAVEHERFATARAEIDGHEIDIASARSESYEHPGALPEVTAVADVEADLGRRDFTINAMAIPLEGEPRLLDPHRGEEDLRVGLLRVLHPRSFVDDPTRAIRAARYAARFGFELEDETAALLRATDLKTVSADRKQAELSRLAGEPSGRRGLELLAGWELIEPRRGGIKLARALDELLNREPWTELVSRERALIAAALGPTGGEIALAEANPVRPSEAVDLARRRDPVELALARALGAEWLDDYVGEWRAVELRIDGSDLLAAGVPEGPGLGRGLAAALRAKLDGEIDSRDEELATALEAAGRQA